MRVLLTIQYDGSDWSGWQSQTNGPSIQDEIERVLGVICRNDVTLLAAGRTDAGVHANDQKAHFDLPENFSLHRLVQGANALLSPTIRVRSAVEVAPDFHARYLAKGKTYTYRIWTDPVADVFRAPNHTHIPLELDVETMRKALADVRGEHDFRAFTVANPEVATTTREVLSAELIQNGPAIEITLAGRGFLRFMVRRIVGSLIEIGSGRIEPDSIRASLEPEFTESRWTAPARGLTLEKVHY